MKADATTGQPTHSLVAEHRMGRAERGVFDEIERRAVAGDRNAQHHIGWNLSA